MLVYNNIYNLYYVTFSGRKWRSDGIEHGGQEYGMLVEVMENFLFREHVILRTLKAGIKKIVEIEDKQ